MKYRTFKVEVPQVKFEGKFAQRVIAIANKEKAQLAFTHEVNIAMTVEHEIVLRKHMKAILEELEFINGINFGAVEKIGQSNKYSNSVVSLYANNYFLCKIGVFGSSEPTEESKYTTYTGNYALKIKEGYGYTIVKDIQELLERLESQLITIYKEQ